MTKRKTNLINFKTGQEIIADSTSEFCKLAGLFGNEKYHFTKVLNGEWLHYKFWTLPSNYNDNTIICDLHNNEYILKELLNLKLKQKLSPNSLIKLIKGDIEVYRGLHVKGRDAKFIIPIRYEYEFDNGKNKFKAKNLSALERKFHRPGSRNFSQLIRGKTRTAYGYRLTNFTKLKSKKQIL